MRAGVFTHEEALDALVRAAGGSAGQHAANVLVEIHDTALAPDDILAALDDDVADQRRDAGIGLVDAEIAAPGIGRVVDDDMALRIVAQ